MKAHSEEMTRVNSPRSQESSEDAFTIYCISKFVLHIIHLLRSCLSYLISSHGRYVAVLRRQNPIIKSKIRIHAAIFVGY
jgi:hypothetical protein